MKNVRMALLFMLAAATLSAQEQIKIDRENKTIAVVAEEEANAQAEVGVLSVGYLNYGSDKDATYRESVGVSNRISDALIKAGIPKEAIETQQLKVKPTELDESWTPEMKKSRQFQAEQSWKVRVNAEDAQSVIDLAVGAGANEVDEPSWDVRDPAALQAKASASALAKARRIADQMAQGLGGKLGDLVYASNRAPAVGWQRSNFNSYSLNSEAVMMGRNLPPLPHLKVFPKKVTSTATVYAVFALQ
jgi:hypothetical protein